MLIVLSIVVISGAVLLGACDGTANRDVLGENEMENSKGGRPGLEGNSREDKIFVEFESNSDLPEQYKEQFSGYIAGLFTDGYSSYYQVKGFEFTNVEHTLTDTGIEITFFLKMINQNFYKDPDTVEYIKEAKENNSKHYQQLYDEYNQPKESNYDLKFTAKIDNGEIDVSSIQLFTNVHPKGVEYVPIGQDFFPDAQ